MIWSVWSRLALVALTPAMLSLSAVLTGQTPAPAAGQAATASPPYDLLLRGAHVIDARNKISAVRDVAIAGGRIAAVAAKINPADRYLSVARSQTEVFTSWTRMEACSQSV